MKIVSTLHLKEDKKQVLRERFPHDNIEHIKDLSELTTAQLESIEILFTYGNNLSDELIRKMKKLRWIHSGQSGVEKLPHKLLLEKEIVVTNSKGINAVAMAEYVMGMILNVEKNMYHFYEAQKSGQWDKIIRQTEIAEKKMVILGTGEVGTAIAKRAKAFDMEVIGISRQGKETPFFDKVYAFERREEILSVGDYIVVAMPLTEKTMHIVDWDFLKRLKTSVILVNIGRGALIKTEDLVFALEEKKIRMAILDVFEQEPLKKESKLWKLDNVIITPHIAGDRIKEYSNRMLDILCNNLSQYPNFEKMKNIVDLKEGY